MGVKMTATDLRLSLEGDLSFRTRLEGGFAERGDSATQELRFIFSDYDLAEGVVQARDRNSNRVFSGTLSAFSGAVPCFTPATQIATGQGLIAVEDLVPGMRVVTRDNGLQTVRWVGRRRFGWRALGLIPALRPIKIRAGALGNGLPERDMVVSPNHRFLTQSPFLGGRGEGLVQAKDMTVFDGVTSDTRPEVEYVQILCDRHELLLADGCWSESFRPTRASLPLLSEADARGLLEVLPELAQTDPAYQGVRPDLVADPGLATA